MVLLQNEHFLSSIFASPAGKLLGLSGGLQQHQDIAHADGSHAVPGDDPALIVAFQDTAFDLRRLSMHSSDADDLYDLCRYAVLILHRISPTSEPLLSRRSHQAALFLFPAPLWPQLHSSHRGRLLRQA